MEELKHPIRYRVFDNERKQMCTVLEISWREEHKHAAIELNNGLGLTFWRSFDECRLLRFTGKQDSKKQDVYEGDRLQDKPTSFTQKFFPEKADPNELLWIVEYNEDGIPGLRNKQTMAFFPELFKVIHLYKRVGNEVELTYIEELKKQQQ